ncbi:MAG TPA: hypothetical protein VK130_08175 [Steroidobacteraceae bacterium]|nr:hypothetical protein [Steroidobacteraceae bacterium]
MNPKTIGGALDYRLLARSDQSIDPARLTEEVVRMSRQGLLSRDISQALNLHPLQVEQILEQHND